MNADRADRADDAGRADDADRDPPAPRLVLILGAELHAPEPLGRRDVLVLGGRIARIAPAIASADVAALGLEVDTLDAHGRWLVPGFIDVHEHLLGGSGESGFASQTPEIQFSELVTAGITSVVGTLGVDTAMKTMPGLLAKVKALREEGLAAWCWSGGYNVPPTTIMGSLRDDLLFIDEVVGAGEIAIADARSTDPDAHELARLVNDCHVGGMLSRKCGRTHFHVGPRKKRLAVLRTLIDDFEVEPAWLYPTHASRSEALMLEAVDLAQRGAFVDIDTVQQDLHRWLGVYLAHGGPAAQLTASSDASITRPGHVVEQVLGCIREHGYTPSQALPLATTHAARAMALPRKGRVAVGCDADLVLLEPGSLAVTDVLAAGRALLRDGPLLQHERFLADSDRHLALHGRR